MKKPDIYLKEYCQRLSDDNLKFLAQRLSQRLSGDMAETFDFLSNVKEIDRWLATATTCNDLFDMIDFIYSVVQKEHDRRSNLNVPISA
jgi:hypothetical protein